MDAVDGIRANVPLRSGIRKSYPFPQSLSMVFGQGYDIFKPSLLTDSLFSGSSVTTTHHQTLQFPFPVGMLHGLHFVQTCFHPAPASVLNGCPGMFQGLVPPSVLKCQKNLKASSAGKSRIDQPIISIFKPNDLNFVTIAFYTEISLIARKGRI